MYNIYQRQLNLRLLNAYTGKIDGIEGSGTKNGYKIVQNEGSGTKNGYKIVQKRYGIAVDGIYGKDTERACLEAIKKIQNRLNELGYSLTVDGLAGTNTDNAVKDFQSKNGLTVDGIVGNNTDAKLFADNLSWDDIKHFKKSEFDCKCGCSLNNIQLEVVKIADEIREHFGKPAIVNSGTRCSKHNKEVGGVANSRHLTGKAIDLYVQGVDGGTLVNYTKQLVNQGKLRYTYRISANGNAVHIDIQ